MIPDYGVRRLMDRYPMLRYLIPALIVINLLLFGRLLGWLPGLIGDMPDPARISRQVSPEQIRILPPPAPSERANGR